MTNAQHLAENAVYALYQGKKHDRDINAEYTRCTVEEANEMAQHIVYSLYDGIFPDEIDIILDLLADYGIDWRKELKERGDWND